MDLWSIILPLFRPALATVALFSFLTHWDSFLRPLICLNTMENYSLPLDLRFFQLVADAGGAPREHLLMAASLAVSIPGIRLFVVAQKYSVRGIVLSGIKG
ncbi:MAG: carbohydrate ABC transporter permease [Caldilineaceae bacterium SB0664_bin_22]|nr:carbohydrate ABC transporter permease [Caldilineaceae bacterium SB0664_bin_22]MYC63988.1 carbohydrate ABC transporter permease [Caldilineaceae bacterium SB0661_bin_34]